MQPIRQHLLQVPSAVPFPPWLFAPSDDDPEFEDISRAAKGLPRQGEDLPYRVEVWSEDHSRVEQTLAMTANGSIGYAAYYEATREFPGRYVVLRHKNRIVARWNPPDS
jgi:hypothetical protein